MPWLCSADRSLPLDQDSDWSGSEAEKSIFAWAGFDGDNPDPSKAARGFLAFNSDDPPLRSSFKLPFARVVNGKLTCVAAGLRAAASRLSSTDIPSSVKDAARAVIESYEAKWSDGDGEKAVEGEEKKPFPGAAEPFDKDDDDKDGKKKPKADAKDDDGDGEKAKPPRAGTIPAKPKPRPLKDIVAADPDASQTSPMIDEADAAEGGESRGQVSIYATRVPIVACRGIDMSAEEQEKIAFDPDIFSQNPPYIFRAQISNDQQDAYFTRMHASSLRNYAQDAADGVALQNSHRAEQLPFGHSFRGRYIQPHAQGDQIAKTIADFYVVPNLQLSDVSNNHLIMGIKSGSVRDVSVGFYGGRYRCTLCGRDMLRDLDGEERCDHIPGLVYRVRAGPDDSMEETMAAAWVHDARLAEVSTVYDGATPGATIMKARRMAEAGRLHWDQARLLESRYRVRLYGSQRYYSLRAKEGVVSERKPAPGEPWPKTHDPSAGIPYHTQADQGMEEGASVEEMTRDYLAEVLEAAGLTTGEDPFAALREMVRAYQQFTVVNHMPLPGKDGRAKPLSAEEERAMVDGRAYRQQLVERALGEGNRAFGPEFDSEYQRERLMTLPVEKVKKEAAAWGMVGDKLFPGGRQTLADGERARLEQATAGRQNGPVTGSRRAPDEAYRG